MNKEKDAPFVVLLWINWVHYGKKYLLGRH